MVQDMDIVMAQERINRAKNMKNKEFIIKAIMSGLLIGLCVDINNRIGGLCGAFLFSIGLLTICMSELSLFTGKVGSSNDAKELFITFVLNIFGVIIMRILFTFNNMFVLGIGCGMLMQIGVTAYKKNLPILTIMCVMAFILAGYKHCIAYAYNSLDVVSFAVIVLGNIIGAKICYYGGVKL